MPRGLVTRRISIRRCTSVSQMLKLEESIKKKTGMVDHPVSLVGQLVGEKEMWMREVKEDREAWSDFEASCVDLAFQSSGWN